MKKMIQKYFLTDIIIVGINRIFIETSSIV